MINADNNLIYLPQDNLANIDLLLTLNVLTSSPLWFKVTMLTITFLCLCFLLLFLYRSRWFKLYFLYNLVEFITIKPYGYYRVRRQWKKIQPLQKSNNPDDWRQAIILANKMIEQLVADLIPNQHLNNLEQRLRALGYGTFSEPKKIWQANMLCQYKLKDKSYQLTQEETTTLITAYQQALRDINFI
ncbi:MAG: hypothetical protein COX77_02300 [Candidatus Komeilibacteria bacterium CG_4_10_14_0_2_um_filter_37_10]|uniref:Uncharacterized protein n=1 Tax=Candidatus Komeilibacteria bacterium CG_4_10_14_0_2_um_filter_37_10 TaxID=1974470 RepID=A0A2M7VF47_9BACT|nr:MAG: hypothetical protein COX77_02300 [Candidatus Komeilibacteria bacterium CG_4_10_14_0_2_um_filter_37_10]